MSDREMTPSKTRVLSLTAVLGGFVFCSCSRPDGFHSGEDGVMLSMEEVMSRPPGLALAGPVKIWVAERSSEMGVYYVLSGRELLEPEKQAEAALRIVLFKGRAEFGVGGTVKVCDGGAYAVVPPGTAWRLKRLGPEPLIFSLLVSPDAAEPADLLRR